MQETVSDGERELVIKRALDLERRSERKGKRKRDESNEVEKVTSTCEENRERGRGRE